MMSTKTEIRQFMRDTRKSFREVEKALSELRFDDACDSATQAAGCAGEVENLVAAYTDERRENRFASGDTQRS
jgi:hypothetical protein